MQIRVVVIAVVFLAVSLADMASASAAVVVVDNQTRTKVEFTIRQIDRTEARHALAPSQALPFAVAASTSIAFDADGQPRRYKLQPNNIYSFIVRDGALDLSELALPGPEPASLEHATISDDAAPAVSSRLPESTYTVPVMILADDQEPRVRAVWEKRLRSRVVAASEIFERCCRVRFQVVAVSTWVSSKNMNDFDQSVAEFERLVRPAPARLAVGFTGRYQWAPGEKHVGGIRGPLHPHILIRNALQRISEPERLEFLVHELGHFLGAVHAPEDTSVMRPTLGDRRACARTFQIGFDASNTLAMYLLGEELRRRPIFTLHQLSPETKFSLRRVYASLAKAMPDDPAARKYLMLLDMPLAIERSGVSEP